MNFDLARPRRIVRLDFGDDRVDFELRRTRRHDQMPEVGGRTVWSRLIPSDPSPKLRTLIRLRESLEHGLHAALGSDADGVEERAVVDHVPESPESCRERAGEPVDPLGDASKTFGAVVDAVHARHDREQDLGGADVAGRLVAANVLLAGLDGHAEGRFAVDVSLTPMRRPGIRRTSFSRTAM